MLKGLSKYEDLGTPQLHFELLKTINNAQAGDWNSNNVHEFYHNKIVEGRTIFDGCVPLLISTGVLIVSDNDSLVVSEGFGLYLQSEGQMIDKLVERILLSFCDDEIFHEIFCSEFISFDVIYRSIQIENSAFPLKYSPFKQLLIDFNVLQDHPTTSFKKFILNSRYKKLFDKAVLPEIKKRKVGVDELKKAIAQKQVYGEEAEKFVLEYESKRLENKVGIEWVAEYSVADGYDIASFNSIDSDTHDRLIEVKSYSGVPYFFWSRNEINIAKLKKDEYYLYLVNRDEMFNKGYSPIIIQNPYENVYENQEEWSQRIEKIRFESKSIHTT